MFEFFKNRFRKDYASVPVKVTVNDISIPVITLEEYPEIMNRIVSLLEKVGERLAEKNGLPVDEVIGSLDVANLLSFLPTIIEVATEELFDLIAFILKIDVGTVKKFGLKDLAKIINGIYEVNEFAEVQKEIGNFMKALKKGM